MSKYIEMRDNSVLGDSPERQTPSEAPSETLSEFVRRRFVGDVPIFGGDPRIGARQLGGAFGTSVGSAVEDLASAMTRFTSVIGGQKTGAYNADSVIPRLMGEVTSEDLERAAELDQTKIELLLSASLVHPGDLKAYSALLVTARTSLVRKRDSMMAQRMRQQASLSSDSFVSDDEILKLVPAENVNMAARAMGLGTIDDELRALLARGLVHDSAFQGRTTNRSMALVGDAVLRLVATVRCDEARMRVSDTNGVITVCLSNQTMAAMARKELPWMEMIVTGRGVDKSATAVLSTVVEALYGAIFITRGYDGVVKVNDATGMTLVKLPSYEKSDEKEMVKMRPTLEDFGLTKDSTKAEVEAERAKLRRRRAVLESSDVDDSADEELKAVQVSLSLLTKAYKKAK